MNGIELMRQAVAQLAARRVGLRTEQPRTTVTQHRTRGEESAILALPDDLRYWYPLQDNTGAFYSMVDFSAVDGGEAIR